MKVFEDKEIVLQKALASKIVKDASRVSAKVDKVCAKIVADIEECEKKLQESNDVQKISVYSKELQELYEEDFQGFMDLKYNKWL